eukprot:280710-Chlamydomonas_euryale.AAC.2
MCPAPGASAASTLRKTRSWRARRRRPRRCACRRPRRRHRCRPAAQPGSVAAARCRRYLEQCLRRQRPQAPGHSQREGIGGGCVEAQLHGIKAAAAHCRIKAAVALRQIEAAVVLCGIKAAVAIRRIKAAVALRGIKATLPG